MKFVASRTTVSLRGNKKPCDEAREDELTPLDFRTVKTLEAAKKKVWYKMWLEGGANHREEGGVIVCDKKEKEKQWVVDIETLEELINFQNRYGAIVIMDSAPYKETRKELKILRPEEK
ncbi:MAG: hypothetical protein C4560_01865 [Nitrospiraceae bacterium]|nr:MAG: hypothetical protein C4560_01865 [Nitrospiraceae bacterium]